MRHPRLALFAAVLFSAACSKCGKTAGPEAIGVERVLPAHAETLVVVPSLLQLGQKISIIEKLKISTFLAQLQNVNSAREYSDALIGQLGIDIRSREAIEKVGIDPDKSAGAAATVQGDRLLALPVKNETRLRDLLATIARQRLGTVKMVDVVEGEITLHRFVTDRDEPKLEYVVSHGYALIAPPSAMKLTAIAVLPEKDSLAQDKAYAASLGRLPTAREVIVYFPPGTEALSGLPIGNVAISAALAASGLTVDVDAPVGDQALTAMVESKAGASLLTLLPDDAFLVARFSGDAPKLQPLLELALGQYIKRAFADGGFDLQKDVLANLKPGSVMGLSLAPTVKMGQGMPALDLKRTNPFSYVHLSGVAPSTDAAVIPATLDKLAAVAPKFGATITKEDHAGKPVFVTRYAQGEGVHFAAVDDRVMFASPMSRLDALLEGKTHAPLSDPTFQPFLLSKGAAVVIDLRKLSAAVKALPSEAWGIGGFAIKATTVRWLEATDDLSAITVGADAKDGVVHGQLQLKLQTAP